MSRAAQRLNDAILAVIDNAAHPHGRSGGDLVDLEDPDDELTPAGSWEPSI